MCIQATKEGVIVYDWKGGFNLLIGSEWTGVVFTPTEGHKIEDRCTGDAIVWPEPTEDSEKTGWVRTRTVQTLPTAATSRLCGGPEYQYVCVVLEVRQI